MGSAARQGMGAAFPEHTIQVPQRQRVIILGGGGGE